MPDSKVKVIGQSSRSQKEKLPFSAMAAADWLKKSESEVGETSYGTEEETIRK